MPTNNKQRLGTIATNYCKASRTGRTNCMCHRAIESNVDPVQSVNKFNNDDVMKDKVFIGPRVTVIIPAVAEALPRHKHTNTHTHSHTHTHTHTHRDVAMKKKKDPLKLGLNFRPVGIWLVVLFFLVAPIQNAHYRFRFLFWFGSCFCIRVPIVIELISLRCCHYFHVSRFPLFFGGGGRSTKTWPLMVLGRLWWCYVLLPFPVDPCAFSKILLFFSVFFAILKILEG